jgi:hypothetical protein
VDYPTHVTSTGGRYHFQDDQETPDTHVVGFEFDGRKAITWEGRSCNQVRPGDDGPDVIFYGDGGALALSDSKYVISDLKGKPLKKVAVGRGGDAVHLTNFIAAARGEAKPNSEIEEGHKSTLLCHLGNIAYRTNTVVRVDPKTGKLIDNPAGEKLWRREYRSGWEPTI